MQVKKAGELLNLSKTELQLLLFLLENAGHILSKESILEKVWGLDGQFVDDNTVTVNISRLKNKLGTDAIENVRGLGYIASSHENSRKGIGDRSNAIHRGAGNKKPQKRLL